MTVRTRILEAAADLLAQSADADASTRAVCDAAGVTAPTLYHLGDKDGLLAAGVDFGWAQFLEAKREVAVVVHEQVADDIRAGWDNHLEFARENPNFYKLMWSPAVAPGSTGGPGGVPDAPRPVGARCRPWSVARLGGDGGADGHGGGHRRGAVADLPA